VFITKPVLRNFITLSEERAMDINVQWFDRVFTHCSLKCLNCGYPLNGLAEHNYSVTLNGKICDLCHAMECAVRKQKGIAEAHDLWKKEQDKKKQILEKGDKPYL
jgi:hypothetical protein